MDREMEPGHATPRHVDDNIPGLEQCSAGRCRYNRGLHVTITTQ